MWLFTCATLLLLSGCSLSPGSHLASAPPPPFTPLQSAADGSVLVQPITAMLISQLTLNNGSGNDGQRSRPNPKLDRALANYDYVVGRGDVLNITVWDHPELTIPAGSFRSAEDSGNWVHNDGTIFYPYVGKLFVAGMTVTQIRDVLTKRLSRVVESPQVDVAVAGFRSQRVYVTGEVAQPGQVAISNVPLTLVDAVNKVGGLSEAADWQRVNLTRDGKVHTLSLRQIYQYGDMSENQLLRHNDVIHIPRNDHLQVFVMGEVSKPQALTINRTGMSLAQALAGSGGLDEQHADASGVFVLRSVPSSQGMLAKIFQLNASDASAFLLAQRFPLEPQDVVYVTKAPLARWNDVVQLLLPTIQSLNQLDNLFGS